MDISYPIVCQKNDGRYYIDFYLNKKRYRPFNAKKIGVDFKPNSYPEKQRRKKLIVAIVRTIYSLFGLLNLMRTILRHYGGDLRKMPRDRKTHYNLIL